ncbi:Nmad3 family putative nucleotide modification protein [Halobacillus mangrovi]|uniref:Nucleotide modification associated domain-containing protein n=1 Tax=Halobacillus mangrovi TaxID=402384 RepID=A0A1W5ZZ78_9BACI|nr:hypothetical protein [Halobacillus mangrovi]ARI78527.1 hypothetical protein HM131_17535 [Halobacillus mangrovi]
MILSRKGFDGSTGGKPSPILGDRLATFHIPRADTDIFYKNLMLTETESYLDIMKDLGINSFSETHLDPDLDSSIWKNRAEGWRGVFGQSGISQGTLHNRNVGPGDLFLFFGWFKQVDKIDGVYRYVPEAPDLHVLFGYLEVNQVIDVNADMEIPKWAEYHPHIQAREELKNKRNAIYVANRNFSKDRKKRGWGTFSYRDELVLTQEGAKNRTEWKIPLCFKDEQTKFTHNIKRWEEKGDGISMQTSGRGDQEMYVSDNKDVVNWAENLILDGLIRS